MKPTMKPTIPHEELYKMLARRRIMLPTARGLVPLLLRIVAAIAMWTLVALPLLLFWFGAGVFDWTESWIKRSMK